MTKLIKVDELIEQLEYIATDDWSPADFERAERIINSLESVDAEPVRHATLLNPEPFGECSCCDELIDERSGFNYCPNCGAKLDGLVSKESYIKDKVVHNWILCADRLPEYYEPVLTWDGRDCCIEKRIPYILGDDGEYIEGEWWVSDEYDERSEDCDEYFPGLRDGAAFAWMPLPKPWGEEIGK